MQMLICHELVLHYFFHLAETNLCSFFSASLDTCCIMPHLNRVCMQRRVAHLCFHCCFVAVVMCWIKCHRCSAMIWTGKQSLAMSCGDLVLRPDHSLSPIQCSVWYYRYCLYNVWYAASLILYRSECWTVNKGNWCSETVGRSSIWMARLCQ